MKISTHHGYDNHFIATDDQVTNASISLGIKYHYDKKQEKNDQSFSFGPMTFDDVLKRVNTSWHCKSVSAIWYSY